MNIILIILITVWSVIGFYNFEKSSDFLENNSLIWYKRIIGFAFYSGPVLFGLVVFLGVIFSSYRGIEVACVWFTEWLKK